jgi:hypothetical protein
LDAHAAGALENTPAELVFDVVKTNGAWKIIHAEKIIGSYAAAARAVSRARERAVMSAAKCAGRAVVRFTSLKGKVSVVWTSPEPGQRAPRRARRDPLTPPE